MAVFNEGSLRFIFPDNSPTQTMSCATQYDDWSFYRNQFTNMFGQAKAVDFIYLNDNTCWLIEVKDYRADRRTKPSELPLEIAQKVRDTLAGLAAARCNANQSNEQQLADQALSCQQLRVVLHIEQPAKPSRLKPQVIDPAHAKQKLKQYLKAIDPHPMVVNKQNLPVTCQWQVEST